MIKASIAPAIFDLGKNKFVFHQLSVVISGKCRKTLEGRLTEEASRSIDSTEA